MPRPVIVGNEQYEKLRKIIELEQSRPVTLDEAKEYGKSLVNIYKALAGNREILGVSRQDQRTESNSPTGVNKSQKRLFLNNVDANR